MFKEDLLKRKKNCVYIFNDILNLSGPEIEKKTIWERHR